MSAAAALFKGCIDALFALELVLQLAQVIQRPLVIGIDCYPFTSLRFWINGVEPES